MSPAMTETLQTMMVSLFWIGSGVMLVIDAFLAYGNEVRNTTDTLSGKAKRFGHAWVVLPYFVGVVPAHIWADVFGSMPGWLAGAIILIGAGIVTLWKNGMRLPMHPLVAFLLGLIAGAFAPV